jgi:hypothetical protein
MVLVTQVGTDKRQVVALVAAVVVVIIIRQGELELLGKALLAEMVQVRLVIMVLAVAVQGQ